jgi:hypothetical protein
MAGRGNERSEEADLDMSRGIINAIRERELYPNESDEVVVVIKKSPPTNGVKINLESVLNGVEEGNTKFWGNGYSTRLDRRPEDQGGDQLHIWGPKNQKWAYRHTGARSEPQKYTLPTTNIIRDIVSQTFGIDRSCIKDEIIRDATSEKIILEMWIG